MNDNTGVSCEAPVFIISSVGGGFIPALLLRGRKARVYQHTSRIAQL